MVLNGLYFKSFKNQLCYGCWFYPLTKIPLIMSWAMRGFSFNDGCYRQTIFRRKAHTRACGNPFR